MFSFIGALIALPFRIAFTLCFGFLELMAEDGAWTGATSAIGSVKDQYWDS